MSGVWQVGAGVQDGAARKEVRQASFTLRDGGVMRDEKWEVFENDGRKVTEHDSEQAAKETVDYCDRNWPQNAPHTIKRKEEREATR